MALQKTIQTIYGVTINDAYHRVDNVSLLNKIAVKFDVASFANKELAAIASKQYICDYNINGENPIKQAYLHLKTLPEFTDAVDC
jgi:hypothetical protein